MAGNTATSTPNVMVKVPQLCCSGLTQTEDVVATPLSAGTVKRSMRPIQTPSSSVLTKSSKCLLRNHLLPSSVVPIGVQDLEMVAT